MYNLQAAHDAIIESRVLQTYHINKQCRDESVVHGEDNPISVGDRVFLSTKNLNIPKGRARKLVQLYIRPFPVLLVDPAKSIYTLELPKKLVDR